MGGPRRLDPRGTGTSGPRGLRPGAAARKAELHARELRFLRASRTAALCWPSRLGEELGWLVPSPIDVRLTPLQDVEVDPDPAAARDLAQVTDHTELWHRGRSALALWSGPEKSASGMRVGSSMSAGSALCRRASASGPTSM